MTNVAISGLPAASALTGPELVPIVQGGTTSRSTAQAISKYVLGEYIDARNYAIDPTGVADSSVAGNQALADAISQKKPLVWPSGVFLLNGPLLGFTGASPTVQMYGQGGAAIGEYVTPPTPVPPSDSNTIFYTNYTNAPAIIVNNCRDVLLKDFAVIGQNVAPQSASMQPTGPSISQADYITTGCQTGRYAPYCGIAFDPFSNSATQTITAISKASSAIVTVSTGASNPFFIGQQVVVANVGGMTQINGMTGTVTAIGGSAGAWTATVNINSSSFSTYTSGGTAVGLPCNVGSISGITAGTSTLVMLSDSSSVNPFQYGAAVTFSGVSGMTQINGLAGTVTAAGGAGPGTWQITVSINSSAFSAYTSGGQVVGSDAYASLATNYQSAYAGQGTYGAVVENVRVSKFVVDIGIGLSGNSALAADLTFRNVNVDNCDVLYAIGQSQSRNLNIEYGNLVQARTGIDGLNYGTGVGTPPQCLRNNFGFLYRMFALEHTIGNCVFFNGYGETLVSMGQFGVGSASSAYPLIFVGGDYKFGFSGWIAAPLILETYGVTKFIGTSIGSPVERDAWNFVMPTAPASFDNCTFSGTSRASVPPHIGLTVDAANGGYAKLLDCWVTGFASGSSFGISSEFGRALNVGQFTTAPGRLAAVYQTYRVSNGNTEYVFLPYFGSPSVAVLGVSSLTLSSSSVIFTCSNAAQLTVGDVLFWQLIQQGYSANKWSVPALTITNITGSTVTCSLMFDPRQYDSAANQPSTARVWVAPNHWAPTQGLTCNTSSSTSLSNVSPATILCNGDFVVGAGIPTNTRVVSGAGTTTVQISQAATATATGVELYFGRLYSPTLTPLT